MAVDRCICHKVPFSQILALSRGGFSLRQIVEQTRCTTGCGMCGPYVRMAIKTGRTSLPVLPEHIARGMMLEFPLVDPPPTGPAEPAGPAGPAGPVKNPPQR